MITRSKARVKKKKKKTRSENDGAKKWTTLLRMKGSHILSKISFADVNDTTMTIRSFWLRSG